MSPNEAWLVTQGRVLASAEVADSHTSRRIGLLGRNQISGAFIIPNCRWVHTIRMRFAIDVAYLDENDAVIKIQHLKKNRIPAPVPKSRTVIEAERGAFDRWGLLVGTVIEIRQGNL